MHSIQNIFVHPSDRRSNPWTGKEMAVFAGVLLLALALRLYFILAINQPGLTGDEANYDLMVKQLLNKGVYGYHSVTPNAYVTPGYPLFLTVLYKLAWFTGVTSLVTVRIGQSILLVACVALVYLISRKYCGSIAALFAALIAALYPPLIWSASAFLTETLFTFAFLAYFYLLITAFEKNSRLLSALSGVFFGVSVLTRPQVAPFFFIPFVIILLGPKKKGVMALFASFTAVFIAVMMPWWVRNYVTLHKIILSATQTGNPLLAGTDPYYRLGMAKLFKGIKPEDQTAYAITRVIRGFRYETLLYLKWFTVGKMNIMYSVPWVRFTGNYLRPLVYLHWPIVILGWLGVLYAAFKPKLRVLAALIVYATFIQLLFLPLPRYVFPLIPFLIIASVCLMARLSKVLCKSSSI